ncbi:MAG: BatA domain-containing protein [Verrucomicrobia bacterium]|nr:BatA domain-containing protein [Verrucomicrobiota bacterium]
MTFLQPEILLGLPLLLVPVVIHLLNRRRYKVEDWGAMQFLIQATRASTSKARLKQILVLFMRTLAVGMLLFFLARPLAGGWVGKMGGGVPEIVFVVLDRSASMESTQIAGGPSLKQQAYEALRSAWDIYGEDSKLVLVDSVDASIIPVKDMKSLMDGWLEQESDTSTSFPLLFLQIHDWIQSNNVGVCEIWIASDLQTSNWQLGDDVWDGIQDKFLALSRNISIKVLAMGGGQPVAQNIGLTHRGTIQPGFGKREMVQLRAQLISNREETESVPVSIEMPGATAQTEVTVEGAQTSWQQNLSISGELIEPWIHLSIPQDSNERDNHLYLVIPPDITPRVEVYSSNALISSIIRAALLVGIPGESEIVIRDTIEDEPEPMTSLIVWQKPVPDNQEAEWLVNFVENGGTVIFLPHDNEENDASELFETRWGQVENAPDGMPYQISNWDQQSGPAARTSEGFTLPLDRTTFLKRRQLISSGSPLVLFSDNASFLSMSLFGRGKTYWLSSLPESDWSTLGQGYAFVPMLQRILIESSTRFAAPVQLEVGRLPQSLRGIQWIPVVPAVPGHSPDIQSGIFTHEGKYIAVNLPVEELELNHYSSSDLTSALDRLEVITMDGPTPLAARKGTADLQSELWKFFLIGMVLFLGVESFLTLPLSVNQRSNQGGTA